MASLDMKIRPFPVPDSVILDQPPGQRQDGLKPLPEVLLSYLSVETLDQLCNEFRAAVFAKAGKQDSGTVVPPSYTPSSLRDQKSPWGNFPDYVESVYAIGDENGADGVGMWYGPVQSLGECMHQSGRSEASIIISFDRKGGNDRPVARWNPTNSAWESIA